MSVPRLTELLVDARAHGYAVGAVNVVDVVTMDGVLTGAAELRSPVIVQTSARTARQWGPDVLAAAFEKLASRHAAPAVLGLDHCTDLDLIDACLNAGWGAVLFDGSALSPARNAAITRKVVARAHHSGAAVEGELESIRGTEIGVASGTGLLAPVEASLEFIATTGIDCFAPAIGNVHGRTNDPPTIDMERARAIADRSGAPLALHGGTGIDTRTLQALIAAGCVKVNVSTGFREAWTAAMRASLAVQGEDPVAVLEAVRTASADATRALIRTLGSAGRA